MKVKFSEKAQELLNPGVYNYISKLNRLSVLLRWIIDSKFRRAVNLKKWTVGQYNNLTLADIVSPFADIKDMDVKVLAILNFWRDKGAGGMNYYGDRITYGMSEYWATLDEILKILKDDCDGFANIIYHSLILAGVPEDRLFIVAGDVKGGGHCYGVYIADDGLEYPIDGCYWVNKSLSMKIPYIQRDEYNFGQAEWFRFNGKGVYKKVY